MRPGDHTPRRRRVHRRGSDEFGRVLGFSDGIFGFAMTLLISSIAIPAVAGDELAAALGDEIGDFVGAGLSFVIVGFYWIAHHGFFRLLAFVDAGLLRLNVVYLAFIAFLPFPTALIGRYENVAIAVILYAGSLAAASLAEAAMFGYARRVSAFLRPMPADVYRFAMRAAVAPGIVFALSIPVALLDTTVAMVAWVSIFGLERLLALRSPEAARAWEDWQDEAADARAT